MADLPAFGGRPGVRLSLRVAVHPLADRYISTHDFTLFGWYRIVFGGVILVTAWLGWVDWTR